MTDLEQLAQYLDQEAQRHATSIAQCDPAVKEHIGLLRRWARAVETASRRTTPDREAIIAAAMVVVRDALEDVDVHPCDVHNDDVRANRLAEPMRALYLAIKTAQLSALDHLTEDAQAMGLYDMPNDSNGEKG